MFKFVKENVKELGNAPTWIIDPIDGTMNFVHSNPLVCTSVGKDQSILMFEKYW